VQATQSFRVSVTVGAWLFLAPAALVVPAGAAAQDAFPRPPELEPDVRFWERIYTQVGTDGGLLHDERNLGIVYEEIRFEPAQSSRERLSYVDRLREYYRRILLRLAAGLKDPNDDERRVLSIWPRGTSSATFKEAADDVRFQLGQADRFRAGLVRSGAWEAHVEATLRKEGLPPELSALPHVESSFNPLAYSKVGAAGMWQFMPSTGRRWLRVDSVVDERLDPYKSTVAAAQYLELDYELLGTWPLALTAYNHGAGGMRRAKELLGTDNIVTIVRDYDSRTFGFASRNFYVSFLAALDIDRHYERFFGPMERAPREASQTVKLADYVPLKAIVHLYGTTEDALRMLNTALREPVWRGERFVPRGFELRVPDTIPSPEAKLAKLPADARYAEQARPPYDKLRRGESLEHAARRIGVPLERLLAANDLPRAAAASAGMRLKLPPPALAPRRPGPAASAPAVEVAATAPAAPAYRVKEGDSIEMIAEITGTPAARLRASNRIRGEDELFVGRELVLAPVADTTLEAGTLEEMPAEEAPAAAQAPEPPASVALAEAASVPPAQEPLPVLKLSPPEPVVPSEALEPELKVQAATLETPGLVPGEEGTANADPSDYSVQDGSIRVQAVETLGLVAEWLEVPPAHLRALNRLRPDAALGLGRRLKLDLSRVSAQEFEQRRLTWHRTLVDSFFARHIILGTDRHRLKPHESLWTLTRRNDVPVWLLHEYNPDVDLSNVRPGTELLVPRIQHLADAPGDGG
jgi:membrane-bound lytic murein transglycosylase D